MHTLFAQVLNKKDLSKAGDLFSLDDKDIEKDLSQVLYKIREIADKFEYLTSDNDQSVVEICTTRVTSAIRETGSIEKHSAALVALLQSCLNHNLQPSVKDDDPPHAKIASDILSCLFLNYTKKSVMEQALPVAVCFLYQGNRELSRNMSSYLSLAAIDNAKLLAEHIQPIVDSVSNGNKSLARVLPQIYSENKDPIHSSVAQLVAQLPECEMAEKSSLLQLSGLIAKNQPSLLEPHVPQLCSFLASSATSTTILQIFVDMASINAQPFSPHTAQFKLTAEQQPSTLALVAKLMGAIGKLGEREAQEGIAFLTLQLPNTDHHSLPILLTEIKNVADGHQAVLMDHIDDIAKYSTTAPVSAQFIIQQLKEMCIMSSSALELPERKSAWSQTEGVVTVITVGNPTNTHTTQTDKVTVLSAPPVSNLPNSKNASTSTREISFPSALPSSLASLPTNVITPANSRISVPTTIGGSSVLVHVSSPNSTVIPISPHSSTTLLPYKRSSSHVHPLNERTFSLLSQLSHHGSQIGSQGGPRLNGSQNHMTGSQHVIGSQGHMAGSQHVIGSQTLISGSQHVIGSQGHMAGSQHVIGSQTHIVGSPGHSSTLPPAGSPQIMSLTSTLPPSGSHLVSVSLHSDDRSLSPQIFSPTGTNTYTGQPYALPFRDAVQQFCEKHLTKIKVFIDNVSVRLPLPIKASLQEHKHKRFCKLHFICYGQDANCLYSQNFFTIRTKNARTWVHLMFLAIQARSEKAVSQQDPSVGNLKACWDTYKLNSGNSFVRLVTSSFPSARDQDALLQELHSIRYFDVFEFNAAQKHWACFLCNHPEKAMGLLQDGDPIIEGQLKEKKGRWKFFKRWKTRYFTLSGAAITYSKKDSRKETLPVNKIQTVKAVRKGMRDLPKAFEIFTNDQTYVFKVKDGKNAEQWVQCLQIAVARSQKPELCEAGTPGWDLAPLPTNAQTKL